MWIARNKDGDLRLFEMPPRRFHEGPMLPGDLTGFNDAVTVGDDPYSFWAVQKYCESDQLDDAKQYGITLYTEHVDNDGKKVWTPYVPECVKNLRWEDDPVEVDIIIKRK